MELYKTGLNIPELHIPVDSVTPQQLNPLGCSFVLQNREDAALAASILFPGSLSCFTDGSGQDGLSGAGYVVYCHNTEWLTEAWSLDNYSTVFQVELDAIGKLTVDLCKWNITNTKVIIHCDSKAAILSLKIAMVKSKTVLNTRSAVSDL